jgi:tol-pal system protein YbgF
MHLLPRNAGPAAAGVPVRLYSVALLVLFGMLGLGSPLAHAESTSKQLEAVRARLDKIERILENQSLVELAQHLDQAQADIRALQGKVDQLENTIQQLKKQRAAPPPPPPVAAVPAPPPPAAAGEPAAGAAPSAAAPASTAAAAMGKPAAAAPADSDVTVDQTVYMQAMDTLRAGSYSVAQISFKDFVANYPNSPLAPNAQYWLAKSYQMTSEHEPAVAAFKKLLAQWPDHAKAPDGMLGLAVTLIDMKKVAEGRAYLVQVTQKYPGTDAAKQATERLAHMGKAK